MKANKLAPLKLKLGHIYVRRDGKLTSGLEANFSLGAYAFPYRDPFWDVAYDKEGRPASSRPGKRSSKDLVRELGAAKAVYPVDLGFDGMETIDCGSNELSSLLIEVIAELNGAQNSFPPFNSLHEAYSVLNEEITELWAEVCKKQKVGCNANLERVAAARKEAVQVAAMALRLVLDVCNESGANYGK